MCGLAGILGDASRSAALLHAMAASLVHRGPDDDGIDRRALRLLAARTCIPAPFSIY